MTNERKRLNPENKNREKHNNIFGNLEGSIDYHNIKNYKINGVSIEEHINTRDNEIKALNARLDAYNTAPSWSYLASRIFPISEKP